MTLNQVFHFTPLYIYIVASVQLFIGFSLCFAIGQILSLHVRELTYYLFSFLFLFIPFIYEIITATVQSGMRSLLFYFALLLTIFLFTRESFQKKLTLFFILIFFDGIIEVLSCSIYWKGICEKLLGLSYTPYINVPDQKTSTLLIFFLPVALVEIGFNFFFPLLWKRYIRFIRLTTFVEIILLPVLCTNGFLIFLPELFGPAGWILLFFILFALSFLFLHAVNQIPIIIRQIRADKEKKKRMEKQIIAYTQYQEQNNLLRKQNHDMNNHLQALSFLLEQNRTDDMKKYIRELLDDL